MTNVKENDDDDDDEEEEHDKEEVGQRDVGVVEINKNYKDELSVVVQMNNDDGENDDDDDNERNDVMIHLFYVLW